MLPDDVEAASGYSEMCAALNLGKMPHEWYLTPRWSRVLVMATRSAQSKLDYIAMIERAESS